MSKVHPISGFPEWLPEQRIVEKEIIALIEQTYQNYGFIPIETPAVELVTSLASTGDISKEIYGIRRLKNTAEEDSEGLGLHFDLTVPTARYVAQHFSKLTFPFKRYQLQKVWRGERPQEGRFREFYQFDIDTIFRDELPLYADAEIIEVVTKVFERLNLGRYQIKLNNRKILIGYYEGLGLTTKQQSEVIIAVDKIDKIGPDKVAIELSEKVGLDSSIISKILELPKIQCNADDFISATKNLGVSSELLNKGLEEISLVIGMLSPIAKERVKIDLSRARGLDYYTGTIMETILTDYPNFGSVCGGGRYDDLASRFINQKLPGVGVSIGLTRLMSLIFKEGLKPGLKSTYSDVLVTLMTESSYPQAEKIATEFREAGINTEVYLKPVKLGKQLEYADKKQIKHVIFIQDNGEIAIKNIETKVQTVFASAKEGILAIKPK